MLQSVIALYLLTAQFHQEIVDRALVDMQLARFRVKRYQPELFKQTTIRIAAISFTMAARTARIGYTSKRLDNRVEQKVVGSTLRKPNGEEKDSDAHQNTHAPPGTVLCGQIRWLRRDCRKSVRRGPDSVPRRPSRG